MKEIKSKTITASDSSHVSQKHSKATEEQIRYAKLSQSNPKEEAKVQEKIKEIQEFTRKPPDIIMIALHDSNYDTNVTIQNILEGRYDDDQGEWQTTNKKGKKPGIIQSTITSGNHLNTTEPNFNQNNNITNSESVEDQDQKPSTKTVRSSRGGSSRGRSSSSRNWRNDEKTPTDEKFDLPHNREGSRERNRSTNDRGRGRGRGRGVRGGAGMARGSRGGRGGGGFGSRGGANRGSRQQRGTNRGGFSKPSDHKKIENGDIGTSEESWDVEAEPVDKKTEDWGEEAVADSNWSSKGNWGDEPDAGTGTSLFSNDLNWSQMNGKESASWDEPSSTSKDDKEKYLPENVDAAVIRSVPTSSTSGEVTSYQPTNDLSRYMNAASNQFPSSHQEGGLTSSLNDRAFPLPSSSVSSDSVNRTVASMPMISGVTESHKLEQEQLKPQRISKPRKSQNKFFQLPKQPVVMPRSAQMVNDIKDQFAGLEFGSGPISPRKVDDSSAVVMPSLSSSSEVTSSRTELTEVSSRHVVASLENEALLTQSSQGLQSQPVIPSSPAKLEPTSTLSTSKSDMPKTPPGFKPLEKQTGPRYMGSPGRGINHMGPEPIPFPLSTSHTSPTNSSSLNVFPRGGGLGTSVNEHQNFPDQQVYDDREQNLNAEKVLAEQRALAEKQYSDHQRALSEHRERERMMADQRAFVEQKSLAQQTFLSSSDGSRSLDLTDRKNGSDTRTGLNDSSGDNTKPPKNDVNYLSNKLHGNSVTSSPSSHQSSYASNSTVSNEMLGLTSATGVQTTAKAQNSSNKVTGAPPGVVPPMNMYPGVQPGMIPAYQHQPIHGYNYEEMLMQRQLVSPYAYDMSVFQAAAAASAGVNTTREGLQAYQGTDTKFTRGTDESSPVSLQQGSHHVAAAAAHQQAAYLNATGQIPFGYTYTYQPGVVPTGGVYPTFTAPSGMYQVPQGKGVGGNQYPSQYQGHAQQGVYSSKYSSSVNHDFNKASYQTGLSQQGKVSHNATSSPIQATPQPSQQSAFKTQYTQDSKGFLGNSPTSANIHMHNQAHLTNMSHYLLQQPVGATHMGHPHHQQHVDPATHRNQVHQMQFNANQAKRDSKVPYQSYWSANR